MDLNPSPPLLPASLSFSLKVPQSQSPPVSKSPALEQQATAMAERAVVAKHEECGEEGFNPNKKG